LELKRRAIPPTSKAPPDHAGTGGMGLAREVGAGVSGVTLTAEAGVCEAIDEVHGIVLGL